jgi:4-hydroxy-2-oxoheptanedioate aldolase
MPETGTLRKRTLKERLHDGEVLVGPATLSSSADVVEIVGHAGFDWVFIDTEQAALEIGADLQNLVRAADSAGIPVIIRPPETTLGTINKILNMGPQGLWIPAVNNAAEAKLAVDAALYPPLGRRGACPTIRSSEYGFWDWDEYMERANTQMLLTLTIETVEGLENVEEIAATPGVDSLCFGPFDLAVDMGLPSSAQYGDEHHWIDERLEAVGLRILKACQANDLIPATLAWSGNSLERWVDAGFRNMMFGLDLGLIKQAFVAHKAEADAALSRIAASAALT